MKTKLVLTLLFITIFMGFSQAQKKVTLHSAKAGDLYERAHADDKLKQLLESTTHLTITGIMDARDFGLFRGTHAQTSNILPLYTSLEEIDLSGVTKIEGYIGGLGPAFNVIGYYEADQLPAHSFYGVTFIDESHYFAKLKKVILPPSIKSIGSRAFFSCTALTSLDIPSGVRYISGIATFANSGLTSLKLPDNIEIKSKDEKDLEFVYELNGLIGGTKITSFHVPANVTQINRDGDVDPFPSTLTSLTFAPESKLESFSALFRTPAIIKIAFPEGLKSINNIGLLDNLKTLEFPSTLEKAINFLRLPRLESIISHAVFPPSLKGPYGESFTDGVDKSKVTVYVPAAAVANYKAESGWKDFNIKIIGSDSESQTISNFSDIAAVLGEEITLSAKASSNLPVTYSIADATVASLSGNVVKVLKEGETTITAKQAGDGINFQAVEKTIKLTVLNLTWLEAPTIIYSGSSAKVVGPKDLTIKFTKFFVNDAEVELKSGVADLTDKTGELSLKATTADGSEVIKLKINKQ